MRRSLTASLALLALVLASPVMAQRTTGAISGTVTDASGAALPGVTVAVSGPNIVGTQTSVTNEHGLYRFINLPPGEYTLSFTMTGFKTITRRSLRVGVGSTIEENAGLEISQLQESVDVVAQASVVDTTSSEVSSNYDQEWVDNAPLRRFSFFDLVAAAPGSLQGGDSNNTSRTMVFGSSYDENSFQVDGVDITDNYFNEALAEPNTDAIQEIEVLSLGAPAEYGNLTGAVYNIVTRQGTNDFHGDAGFYLQTDGLTSNNTEGLANPDGSFLDACPDGASRCPFTRDRFTDVSLQLGGPIVKDKLWFFASYSNQRDYYWDVGVDASNDLTAVRGRTDRYFGKLNWQLNGKHKLVGTFHLDKKKDDGGLSANSSPETAATRSAKTPTPGLGYTGVLSDRTVLEVRYSGFYGNVQFNPTDPNQPRDLNRFYDIDTGFISGGHYYWYDLGPKRTTVTAKVSHLADNFLGGSHDFRFGVQYSAAAAGGLVGYNDLIYTYSQTDPGYGYGISYTPFSYSGDTKAIGVFLDDTVRVNNRLSLSLGLRFDSQKAFSAERPQLDEFGNPTGTTFPQTDYFTWNTLSPRLGLNWKLTADGRTVFKAHYGRYHRAVATGEYANKLGPSITPIFVGPYDIPSGTFGDLTLSRSNENLGFDPDYKSPYTDQFIASLERELKPGLGAQLNYVYKRGRLFAGWQEIAGTYIRVPYVDDEFPGATGRTIELFQLVSDPNERQFRITNPPDFNSDINAVSFGLLKRMSANWQLTASATWLRAKGSLQEGQGGAGEAGSGVGIIQRGGLQFRQFGQNPNSYVNVDGRLKSDVEWQFKVQAIYRFPAGILASLNFSNRSGAHLVRRTRALRDITHVPENTPILLQPRGENGRLESLTILDMRLQKDFKLGSKVHLAAFADAFNLLNSDTTEGVVTSLVESSSFLYPLSPVNPRRFMLGTKVSF
jgi:carboxypeptidase family protein/TonB-dependent receptor-like protein